LLPVCHGDLSAYRQIALVRRVFQKLIQIADGSSALRATERWQEHYRQANQRNLVK
jgi:hypothetical protein